MLYDGDSNGDITLSASAANYTYMRIFYRSNDDAYNSVDIYTPNGKKVCLMTNYVTPVPILYMKVRIVSISGTSIATFVKESRSMNDEIAITGDPAVIINNIANIYITRVEAWNV